MSESSKKKSSNRRSKNASATSKNARGSRRADAIEAIDIESDEAARAALRDSDKLYYRIGEVSRLTGVKAHVLRYWETEFRWMAPPKSRSKQRLYRKRDIEFVWLLKRLLWSERYTIAGARQRIQELGVDGALALLDLPSDAAAVSAEVAGVAGLPAGTEAVAAAEAEATARKAEWVSFRAALSEMQNELVALRGVLQEGA